MIYIWLNIVAIATSAFASFAVATIWQLFARRGEMRAGAWSFLALFWTACILAGALILAPPQAPAWVMAVGTAFIVWIGFVAPAIVVVHRQSGRSWKKIASDAAQWLSVLLTMAVVLRLFELVAPG